MRNSVKEPQLIHPCFQESCHGKYGRIHLPVAPACNIQCAYCDRRYDCANESRPGVTSEVISPEKALERTRQVVRENPAIRVAGIAGPGEPLANEATFETLRLLKRELPGLLLCTSTNGLILPECLAELLDTGLQTLTITINALEETVARRIYREEKTDVGRLLAMQREGLYKSCEAGLTVKINTVLIPGVNESEIEQIAKLGRGAGAAVMNLIPLIPCGDMMEYRKPTGEEVLDKRKKASRWIRQFSLCRQCRADACGMI